MLFDRLDKGNIKFLLLRFLESIHVVVCSHTATWHAEHECSMALLQPKGHWTARCVGSYPYEYNVRHHALDRIHVDQGRIHTKIYLGSNRERKQLMFSRTIARRFCKSR